LPSHQAAPFLPAKEVEHFERSVNWRIEKRKEEFRIEAWDVLLVLSTWIISPLYI